MQRQEATGQSATSPLPWGPGNPRYAQAVAHWDKIRASIKPFEGRWPAPPPSVYIELTGDKEQDLRAFEAEWSRKMERSSQS